MRALVMALFALPCVVSVRADGPKFANAVKASLVFRDDFNPTNHYPHVLKVFLRLHNVQDSDVSWVADAVSGIHAELLDTDGKPVPLPPQAWSVQSNPRPFNLPYGSRMDWLITHGGVSIAADAANQYVLMIGCQGWLIPISSAGSYSLRIRLYGQPWTDLLPRDPMGKPELLLDLPPTKLEITK